MSKFSGMMRNETGYLLFEVVLAVAILSLGLVVLLRCFSTPLRAVRVSENYLRAALLAEEKMEELQTRYEGFSQSEAGVFPSDAQGFAWKSETFPTQNASCDGSKTIEIRLTVFFAKEEDKRSICLTSLAIEE